MGSTLQYGIEEYACKGSTGSTGRGGMKSSLFATTIPSQIESGRKARVICSRASSRAREQITSSALSQTQDPPSSGGSIIVESFGEREVAYSFNLAASNMIAATFVMRSRSRVQRDLDREF